MRDWPPTLPPPDAYSRVTNPERFRPLIEHAETVIAHLFAMYDVERVDAADPPAARAFTVALAHAPYHLVPRAREAAPLTVGVTTFPGLVVRCGWWCEYHFPICGCDACDEDATSEIARFDEMIAGVVHGGLTESAHVPAMFGDARVSYSLRSPVAGGGHSAESHQYFLSRDEALRTGLTSTPTHRWAPWVRR
jgi:hypothetical protein